MTVRGRTPLREALERLGVDRLVLGIHEAALPSAPGIETGRGSLASRGAAAFFRSVAALGFDGVQLGPSGMTDRGNPSPYDGTLFSRNLLSIDLEELPQESSREPLVSGEEVEALSRSLPSDAGSRVPYDLVLEGRWDLLGRAAARLERLGPDHPVNRRLEEFSRGARDWLPWDALYEALALHHGSPDWRTWPSDLDRRLAAPPPGERERAGIRRREVEALLPGPIATWRLGQLLAAEQRDQARKRLRAHGLDLYGDLQVGFSPRDEWRFRNLLLEDYRLGAPPSRTNPEGQPWGYPVLDPDLWGDPGDPGPALRFLDARLERAFRDFDALRIDHPHGLVDPWVYRPDPENPFRAVQRGARLFSTPDDPLHVALARWAIARPDQLDRTLTPWADDRVGDLDERQVRLYGRALERAVLAARQAGRSSRDVVCEILSTLPRPVGLVLQREGLGRFRVAQKANPADPADVYRPSNARPEDWVMLGNHDTPSIWEAIDRWRREGTIEDRAADTASRLAPPGPDRERLERELLSNPKSLARGMLADLLASPARQVYVFFTDLLGIAEPYNRPGEIHPDNWTLRVPPDYRRTLDDGPALDLAGACELALRTRPQ